MLCFAPWSVLFGSLAFLLPPSAAGRFPLKPRRPRTTRSVPQELSVDKGHVSVPCNVRQTSVPESCRRQAGKAHSGGRNKWPSEHAAKGTSGRVNRDGRGWMRPLRVASRAGAVSIPIQPVLASLSYQPRGCLLQEVCRDQLGVLLLLPGIPEKPKVRDALSSRPSQPWLLRRFPDSFGGGMFGCPASLSMGSLLPCLAVIFHSRRIPDPEPTN